MSFDEVAQRYPLQDYIDLETFDQVLEMDDDDSREFSKSIVNDFYTQAEGAFQSMDSALASQSLAELSSLGHFMKGSSATLGLIKIKDCCEKMQHLGSCKDPFTLDTISAQEALATITQLLSDLTLQYRQTREILGAMGY